jgi:hypothetical protein
MNVSENILKQFDEADEFIREYDSGLWELTPKAQEIEYDDVSRDGKRKKYSVADSLTNAMIWYRFIERDDPEKMLAVVKVIGWKTRARSLGVLIPSQNKAKELNDLLEKERQEHEKHKDKIKFLEGEANRLEDELAVEKALHGPESKSGKWSKPQ